MKKNEDLALNIKKGFNLYIFSLLSKLVISFLFVTFCFKLKLVIFAYF